MTTKITFIGNMPVEQEELDQLGDAARDQLNDLLERLKTAAENRETDTAADILRTIRLNVYQYREFGTELQRVEDAIFSYGTELPPALLGEFRLYVDELQKMGATIDITGNTARIMGSGEMMHGASVSATDLRAGAALVIAALAAKGESVIGGVEYINRGYYDFVGKLRALGADITLIDEA